MIHEDMFSIKELKCSIQQQNRHIMKLGTPPKNNISTNSMGHLTNQTCDSKYQVIKVEQWRSKTWDIESGPSKRAYLIYMYIYMCIHRHRIKVWMQPIPIDPTLWHSQHRSSGLSTFQGFGPAVPSASVNHFSNINRDLEILWNQGIVTETDNPSASQIYIYKCK